MLELPERFTSKYVVEDRGFVSPCWMWTANTCIGGYGVFSVECKSRKAHRVAYEAVNGPVAEGMVLDHFVCDTRSCVNPDHVREVSQRENVLRGSAPTAINAAKRECKRGHPFDEENTGFQRNGRYCRECERTKRDRRDPRDANHGTESGYSGYRCRCELCVAAHANYRAEYNQRLREKRLALNA